MQEYLAYTTEETEKMEVRELAEKPGGDMEAPSVRWRSDGWRNGRDSEPAGNIQ